jgi:hypothetical protein
MMADFLYVCDGAVPSCAKTACRWTGAGECAHTSDVSHARYPEPRVFADFRGDGSMYVENVRKEDADER